MYERPQEQPHLLRNHSAEIAAPTRRTDSDEPSQMEHFREKVQAGATATRSPPPCRGNGRLATPIVPLAPSSMQRHGEPLR